MRRNLRRQLFVRALETKVVPDATPAALAGGPFTQNWTTTTLIGVNDNWSGVPSIIGYLGDFDAGSPNPYDPSAQLGDATTVDVIANQANPNTQTAGGVAEFEITDPVVALQGSGTADAPFLLLHLNSTGVSTINLGFNLRDVDGSADNSIQPVAVQYRVGNAGSFTNLLTIADASSGPSLATLVTPVFLTLPAAADNQALVQVRIMTGNAFGSDEWIGIDDIEVTTGAVNAAPVNVLPVAPQSVEQNKSLTIGTATLNAIAVSDVDAGAGALKVNLKATDAKLTLGGTTGLTFNLGDGTDDVEMTFTGTIADINAALENSVFTPTAAFFGTATLKIVTDDQGNTGPGGAKTDTDTLSITVNEAPIYHSLAGGDLKQDWTNTALLTTDDTWPAALSIRGYRGDSMLNAFPNANPQTVVVDGATTPIELIANKTDPITLTSGGIAEFEITNPVVALQGSGTADAPHLVLYINSTGVPAVRLKFNAIDVDGAADNAIQQIAVQWRAGTSGDFTDLPTAYIADASEGPSLTGKITAVDVTLPPGATGVADLQIRIITCDATGSDEWIGIDDIEVLQGVPNANQPPQNKLPTTQHIDLDTPVTFSAANLNAISITDPDIMAGDFKVSLKVANGTFSLSGITGLAFSKGDGTADAEMVFTGGDFAVNSALEGLVYTPNSGFKGVDTFTQSVNDQGNTGGAAQSDTDSFSISINPVIEGAYHNLFSGPLLQNWSNAGLITADDDWSGVPSIIGFRGDNLTTTAPGLTNPQDITAYGKPPTIDVIANQGDTTITAGGVAEFDTITNPTVALQGSGTADAPHLTFYLSTLNVTSVVVQYDLIDIDGTTDNVVTSVAAEYRVGNSGPFIDLPAGLVLDATAGPGLSGQVSAVSFTLPAAAEGQAKVQVRVITADAASNDEWVGVDNINISATPGAAPAAKVSNVKIDDGTSQRSLIRTLAVTFDQKIDTPLDVSAFSLNKQGGGSVVLGAMLDGTGTIATITFVSGEVDPRAPALNSLKNGRYDFTIDASKITTGGGTIQLDGDNNGTAGGNYILNSAAAPGTPSNVWRLFGDVDGDNDVDSIDFGAFRSAFGTGATLFDFDGDGDTDATDFGAFRSAFGTTV